MTPERWQQIKSALDEAMALSGHPREAYLERLRATDSELCKEVTSLLAAAEAAGSRFLHTPAPAALGVPTEEGRFVGRRLGPYELVAEIGSGGMGEVYRAVRVDQEYQQEAAIKLVRAGRDLDFVGSRLRTERQILANLEHPNIARLLDGGTTQEGIPYLVMELIDGQPITEYCDAHHLDTTARLKLFMSVCSAVQYAHQRMVIHRDLKPSNILVTANGVPKLLDFGIAKILEPGVSPSAPDLTINAFRILTPQYASPEQFKGESVTAGSDVYSLGVILYEMLTGFRPYPLDGARLAHDLARTMLDYEPRRPSAAVGALREGSAEKLSRRLRGDLDNIVLMALRKEPERRYATVGELAEDIRRHLQHLPVVARGDSLRYRITTFIRRHTAWVAAASVVAVALIGGIVITTREASIAEVQRARAERRFHDVRKLADSLMFDIHDSIRDLAGAGGSRRLLIGLSLQYLDGLAREAAGDPDLERDLAAAYTRLGDIQGRMFSVNEGDYKSAKQSFLRSLDLLHSSIKHDPVNLETRRDLVVACGKLSDLFFGIGESERSLFFSHQASDSAKQMADLAQTAARGGVTAGLRAARTMLATSELDYAHKIMLIQGTSTLAQPYARHALDSLSALLTDDPKDRRVAHTTYYAYLWNAQIPLHDGRYAEALPLMEAAHRVSQTLASAAPNNSDLDEMDTWAEYWVADVLMGLDRMAEAKQHTQAALDRFQGMLARDPNAGAYHYDVGVSQTQMARIFLREGQPERAIELLQEASRRLAPTPGEQPIDIDALERWARAQSLLGDAYMVVAADTRQKPAERASARRTACERYQDALRRDSELRGRSADAAQQVRDLTGRIHECEHAQGA
jgi:non-specific serine/threonine protein kinase/serine/threonine-protein kinase